MAKFEKGRLCLVLRSECLPEMTGRTIVLNTRHDRAWAPGGRDISVVGWTSSPQMIDPTRDLPWLFPQQYLLPLDDDDINKELRDELLEVKPVELV